RVRWCRSATRRPPPATTAGSRWRGSWAGGRRSCAPCALVAARRRSRSLPTQRSRGSAPNGRSCCSCRTAAGRRAAASSTPTAGCVWTQDLTWLGNVTREEQGHQVSGGASLEGMATAKNVTLGYGTLYSLGATSGADGTFALEGMLDREYALFAIAPGTLCAAGPAM